jgi:hypothetical protein
MASRDPQALIEKLKTLRPERIAEVENFVDFLCSRDRDLSLMRRAMHASEPSFAEVWDNDDDAAYDEL